MSDALTDAELDRQIAEATARAEEADRTQPRATSARYDASTGRIVIDLRNGCLFAFPADLAQGLRGAPADQLAEVEVDPGGAGLHWETLDVDLSVAGLVSGVFGGKAWMCELEREGARKAGRRGGQVRGGAKAAAARANGARGGRPPVRVDTAIRGGQMKVETSFRRERREVTIERGRRYVVLPINPLAKRNRNREVTVEEFAGGVDGRVRVRFVDTGRTGFEEPSNLVPLDRE